MSLATALRAALQVPHPQESQDKVHDILARQLHGLTPRATVEVTGYFNHSWAPDFVISSGDVRDRPVFVRFGVHDESFADDLRYLGDERPMFLDLDDATTDNPDLERPPSLDVVETLQPYLDSAVLVAEVPGLEKLESSVREVADVRTATGQVMLGGRGLVDEPGAGRIVESWQAATAAVQEASVDSLRDALVQVREYLSRVASLDLETTLRSRWIAAGQSAESFPGQEQWELADRAPWEIARLVLSLLETGGAVSPEQWQQIAEAVSGSVLGHEAYQVGRQFEGGQVNALARAGVRLWTARYAYVPLLESDSLFRFDWSIGHYSLALNLIRRKAYFTDIPTKWNRVQRSEQLPDALSRLPMLETAGVSGVGLVTPEESVSHELRPTASQPLGERLKQLLGEGDAAWRAARLTSLHLSVPGTSADAHIDFARSVVKTSEPIPLRTYALLCGKYVAGLDEDELAELELSMDFDPATA